MLISPAFLQQPTAPPGAAPIPSGALPLDDLCDAARHGDEFARHHDDRRAVLLSSACDLIKRARFSRGASAPWAMARCLDPGNFDVRHLDPGAPQPDRQGSTLI